MKLLLTLILAIAAHAQTAVRPEQQKAAPAPQPRVIVFLPTGEAKIAELGPGLVLDLSNPAAPVLRVVPAASITKEVEEDESTLPGPPITGIVLKNVPVSRPWVFANGLLQTMDIDYRHTPGSTQITMLRPYALGEIIRVLYRRTAP